MCVEMLMHYSTCTDYRHHQRVLEESISAMNLNFECALACAATSAGGIIHRITNASRRTCHAHPVLAFHCRWNFIATSNSITIR
jgi:hypothetical protein